ncbi:ABC transporter substrate-binding protein [Ancylomarina longa]|uniref:Fe/B12 periplasmic-binding domain-containing protein n=1 Tax=Ancylomarina longa TaxID=2487017 RepID=A0A434AXB0_9BACT|nr:ABC transporter substrate-binding protein [Ancylomarina longa]RUT79175.1 hypothetical protein DLK05_04990 [Ancylomarina longa]
MAYRFLYLIVGICFIGLLESCHPNQSGRTGERKAALQTSVDSGFFYTSTVKYAEGFSIKMRNGFKEIIVNDPWNKGKIFQSYYLVPKSSKLPDSIPADVQVVRTPVKTLAALSNTHIGILKFLGVADRIVALSLSDHIYDKELSRKAEEGKIQGVGHAHQINFEKIVELSPEIVMLAGFMTKTKQEKKLVSAGLPVVYNIEWMESDPLARAEWAKFIAAFFNKEKEADKLFNDLDQRYQKVKSLVQKIKSSPSVVSGYQFKGIWYMPGGKSYLGQVLRDSKGDYCWLSDTTRGSIPLSFEVVYEKQANADIWFGPAQCASLEQLKNMDERYTLFKAYKTGQVYCCTKRMTASGANDWWESGIMKPDTVLKDIIKILHPEVLPDYELYFYKKLN